MTRADVLQYLTDPRELDDTLRDSLEGPVVAAIIATGLAAEAEFPLDPQEWTRQGLMNDFEQGGIPEDSKERIISYLRL